MTSRLGPESTKDDDLEKQAQDTKTGLPELGWPGRHLEHVHIFMHVYI